AVAPPPRLPSLDDDAPFATAMPRIEPAPGLKPMAEVPTQVHAPLSSLEDPLLSPLTDDESFPAVPPPLPLKPSQSADFAALLPVPPASPFSRVTPPGVALPSAASSPSRWHVAVVTAVVLAVALIAGVLLGLRAP